MGRLRHKWLNSLYGSSYGSDLPTQFINVGMPSIPTDGGGKACFSLEVDIFGKMQCRGMQSSQQILSPIVA